MPEIDRSVKTSRRYRRFSFVVAVLLLALQAIAVICPPTENDALQSKTLSINPPRISVVCSPGDHWTLKQRRLRGWVCRGCGPSGDGWSSALDDWVSVRDLQVGERLQTA